MTRRALWLWLAWASALGVGLILGVWAADAQPPDGPVGEPTCVARVCEWHEPPPRELMRPADPARPGYVRDVPPDATWRGGSGVYCLRWEHRAYGWWGVPPNAVGVIGRTVEMGECR